MSMSFTKLKKNLFLDRSNSIRIFKQMSKYFVIGLLKPSTTYRPPAKTSTKGLTCETHSITVLTLMHRMQISNDSKYHTKKDYTLKYLCTNETLIRIRAQTHYLKLSKPICRIDKCIIFLLCIGLERICSL
jgi:hypothetical protein